MQHVSQAMLAFHKTLEGFGVDKMVTTFTASDFGRTLSGNGDGSDHGWGGHHFVMGGSVKGGAVYGLPPPLGEQAPSITHKVPGNPTQPVCADKGRGRLIPTISVDQYGAAFARRTGVGEQDMNNLFPNSH